MRHRHRGRHARHHETQFYPPHQQTASSGKTIDKFTPRELMEELAKRGYSGKLAFMQTIDIRNF